MNNPPRDLRNYLAAAGLGLTTGTNLFTGLPRAISDDTPVNAVFVYGLDGVPPYRLMGEPDEVLTAVVNVTVRWGTYGAGDTKIRDIRDQIQAATVSGYLDVVAQTPEPVQLGQDDDGNHSFMITVEMTHIQERTVA